MKSVDYNPNNFYHKIFFDEDEEFELVRSKCLEEDNWLRDLYTKENLILEKHRGYGVIFEKTTNEPFGMAGVFNDGRYPINVARHLHREYLFPRFRSKSRKGFIDIVKVYYEHIFKPLNSINNFDVYIIAMQNRYKKESKGYWEIFSGSIMQVAPEWKLGQGYIQTCPFNVQKCWQNYLYYETKPHAFTDWNKKIIFQEEWNSLIQGK